jgi:ubiquinone/menaquinone biosynthesis C-methylase UbiE
MNNELQQIADQQKESWNKFSPGWKKWDEMTMNFLKPMGEEIIRSLKLKETDVVLDIATGTGEPGLTIAGIVKKGRVTGTDISEGMLAVARENAEKRGINNFETVYCDVTEMPFDSNYFDAISCRFGFMFFPDMALAIKEMVRVLKPGGRIATSVWNVPEKNFWVTATMGTIMNTLQVPPPPPGAPGMFRCAKAGLMTDLFRQSGLKNVSQVEVPGKLPCGTADVYWNLMTEIAAPVVAALDKADDPTKLKIKNEVLNKINEKYPSGNVAIDSNAIVIYGEK